MFRKIGCSHELNKIVFSFRYNTILPYDENRVDLIAEIDGSDYINASWITDKREIATQGPLTNTDVHYLQIICIA